MAEEREDKKVRVWTFLSPSVHQALLSQKSRTGQSLSSMIEQAVQSWLDHDRMRDEIRQAGESIRSAAQLVEDVRRIVVRQSEDIARLEAKLAYLEKALAVSCFWSALAIEMMKSKVSFSPPEKFEQFKSSWKILHEVADRRVEALLGRTVWNQKFDPTKWRDE